MFDFRCLLPDVHFLMDMISFDIFISVTRWRKAAVNVCLCVCVARSYRGAEPQCVSDAEDVGHVVSLVRGGQRGSEQQRNAASNSTQG